MTITIDAAEDAQTSVEPSPSITSLSNSCMSELKRFRMRPRGVFSNHPTGARMILAVMASCMVVEALRDARLSNSALRRR